MNKVTKLHNSAPMLVKVGSLYEIGGEHYILAQFNNKFFLTNLRTGSTYAGCQNSIEEAFGDEFTEFTMVNEPIVLTPEN